MATDEAFIEVRWWGQACFSITDRAGVCVLVDPFPEGFGYPMPNVEPQVCLVTHEHRDHNATETVKGKPTILRGPGEHEATGNKFRGIATFHDAEQGAKRGPNTVFAWEMAGLRIVHVGDLGHLLTEAQVKEVGSVDVLMVPVGGFYTIDARQAIQVAGQLKARVILPMHYKTAATPRLPIAPIEDFLASVPADWVVQRPETLTLTLKASELRERAVTAFVLKYE